MPKPVYKKVDDLLPLIEAVMPGFSDHYLQFYDDVIFDNTVCGRCGAQVHTWDQVKHNLWHRNISVGLFTLQGWALSHMKETHADTTQEEDVPDRVSG